MIGLDHFAVRGTGWKAPQLIDYAALLKLDTLFLSELGPFESFEDDYLKKLKSQADAAGLKLYTGGMSICRIVFASEAHSRSARRGSISTRAHCR